MKISIDANNETLTISDTRDMGPDTTFIVLNPLRQRMILSEIFNRLDIAGVTLEYIDKDRVKTKEW